MTMTIKKDMANKAIIHLWIDNKQVLIKTIILIKTAKKNLIMKIMITIEENKAVIVNKNNQVIMKIKQEEDLHSNISNSNNNNYNIATMTDLITITNKTIMIDLTTIICNKIITSDSMIILINKIAISLEVTGLSEAAWTQEEDKCKY